MRITIIGAGPGGYIAAFEAAKHMAEVTLIEYDHLGGTCLNYGCIPTKTLKSSAEALEIAHNLKSFGINSSGTAEIDMPALVQRKTKVTEILRNGIQKSCANYKINVVKGRGEIISSSLVKVSQADGTILDIESDKIIIATGSRISDLPSLKFDHKYIISSDDALELQEVPKSMIIVGGGVIGCELAGIYSAFGTEVTIVEGLSRLLPIPSLDEEMSKILQREMKKSGIKQELCRIVSASRIEDNKVIATLAASPFVDSVPEYAKEEIEISADVLVICAGRASNTEGLGLENIGLNTDRRGFITTNEYYETNISNVYAIGDVLGPEKIMLAHVASAEAVSLINKIFTNNFNPVNYNCIPSAIFTSPEIGAVGLSEAQAREQNIDVECPIFQFRELGKSQAMNALAGCFKCIIEKDSGKLLGCHIAGAHATDLIAEATLAIEKGLTLYDIAHTVHAHPTLAEGLYELAHKWVSSKGD